MTIAANYRSSNLTGNKFLGNSKVLAWIARDWTVGAVLRYGSGLPIQVPLANNALATCLFTGGYAAQAGNETFVDRVPRQPLFTVDLNCHCYDPNKTFVLNAKAWTDPPPGQFGTAAAY